jgi:hypothetical protein
VGDVHACPACNWPLVVEPGLSGIAEAVDALDRQLTRLELLASLAQNELAKCSVIETEDDSG